MIDILNYLLAPVSYTHLDVYKRQHERLEALLKMLPAGTVIHQQNFYYTGPVSYTHLYVYKRQGHFYTTGGAETAVVGTLLHN